MIRAFLPGRMDGLENRRTKVELYEEIRREYEHGSGTIREVSRKLGVHRREVRKALCSAIPAARKVPERDHPKLAPAIPFINVHPGDCRS